MTTHGQVRLALADQPQEQAVGGLGDEGQGGSPTLDPPLVNGGLEGDVDYFRVRWKGRWDNLILVVR